VNPAVSAPVVPGPARFAGPIRAVVIFGLLLAFAFVFPEHWVLNMGFFTLMYAALAQSWNLMGGYSGYVSLGHAAFFGLGAYAETILFNHIGIGSSGLTPFFVLPAVGVAVGLVSVPIAWVALRTRAMTFAIVTLTLLFVVQDLAFNLHGITHGSQGASMPPPSFGIYEQPFYLCILAILVLATFVVWHVGRAKLGLMLFAIRDDEDKARGLGVRVTGAKVLTFALSVGMTAMIGGLWAYYIGYIYPQFAVDPLVMIGSILPVFLGGAGTVWGPVLGAMILVPAQQWFAYEYGASELYLIAYAAVFLVIILLLPRGILPSIRSMTFPGRWRRGDGPAASVRPAPAESAAS
jgi:branched-chain amino acid transport system permease protein